MAAANTRLPNRTSQFCLDYGKQEGGPADHTIHVEIKNFLEFARNKAVLTTGDVDILGSKFFVKVFMASKRGVLVGEEPDFHVVVCSRSNQQPVVSACMQFVLPNDVLSRRNPLLPPISSKPRKYKFGGEMKVSHVLKQNGANGILRMVITLSVNGKCRAFSSPK